MKTEAELRNKIRERGYDDIADLPDVLWGVLHKFAAGEVSETSTDGVWFLKRESFREGGGSPYATWCAHCNFACKVYQNFTHHEGCPLRGEQS